MTVPTALVHLGAGIGNIVLATPLLQALHGLGYTADVCLSADYPQTASLLADWYAVREVVPVVTPHHLYSVVLPAIPPFYWPRFRNLYHCKQAVRRPADELFYRNEQAWYLAFADALGASNTEVLQPCLPISPARSCNVSANTVVLAPGSKTGEMASKRWPHFVELSTHYADIAVIGVADDLFTVAGEPLRFPAHVQMLVGKHSLRETAEIIAAAGLVIANDTGLGHLAVAVGTPTLLLFGPTPHLSLGPMPSHVSVLRSSLECRPCWFDQRFYACQSRVDCLSRLSVETVLAAAQHLLCLVVA